MQVADLKRFADFQSWSGGDLRVVAGRARRLRVPADRWLVRPGRTLALRVFLLEGRVRLLEGRVRALEEYRSVIVNGGSKRARRAVYPGAAGIQTLTAALFLGVDPALLQCHGPTAGEARPGTWEVSLEESSWQRRFLTSPLMQRLEPAAWQRILRAMSRQHHPAGGRIIEAGQCADCCYVLCSGRAEIRHPDSAALLAVLEPGCLFGEDALISGALRNAHVVMRTAGSVVALPAERFQAWLLDEVVQPLPDAGARPIISLEAHCPGAAACMAIGGVREAGRLLPRSASYAIVGGTWQERALVAFLLAEQGVDASPVQRVRPVPCGPAPSAAARRCSRHA